MKRYKFVILAMCLGLFLGCLSVPTCEAQAATKKSSKKTQQVVSEDEVLLNQLVTYRDMLVLIGAAPAEIEKANKAIENQQLQIALKAQVAQQKAAQEAAQAQYNAALTAMLGGGVNKSTAGVVFVGDSRFVQMHQAMGETGVIYVAQGWMGYDWFEHTAVPAVDAMVGPGVKIVINLGINDLDNLDNYVKKVNEVAALWSLRGAKVYYATVNPAAPTAGQKDYMINDFNTSLANRLIGVTMIDTNSFLKFAGYKLVDDVHYDGFTSAKVYYYIMNSI